MAKIKLMIDTLGGEPSAAVRVAVAEKLSNLVEVEVRSNIDALDASVIDALAARLDDPNDDVRYFVATALGHFGARASRAVPALERVLKEVVFVPGSGVVAPAQGSATAILGALQRIRGKPPDRRK
jgi:HEAT repeat protein